jgi:hypothetical protein
VKKPVWPKQPRRDSPWSRMRDQTDFHTDTLTDRISPQSLLVRNGKRSFPNSGRLARASVTCPTWRFFSSCSDPGVGSAPFPLFPRVILTPVFSRAYSGPATPFNNPVHKIKVTVRARRTNARASSGRLKFLPRNRLHCRLHPPRHDQVVRNHRHRKPAFFAKVFVLSLFYGSGGAKFSETLQRTEAFKGRAPTKLLTEHGRNRQNPMRLRACPEQSRTGQLAKAFGVNRHYLRCHPSPNNGIGRRRTRGRRLRPNGSIALLRMCAIASSTESVA